MMLRCPVCRAENSSGPLCRRCRADLSLLVAVEGRREFHLAAARHAAGRGELDVALAQLDRAAECRAGDDLRRLRAGLLLLAGDYAGALRATPTS